MITVGSLDKGASEPPNPHPDHPTQHPTDDREAGPAGPAELCARAAEHAPGAVLEPAAARRLDALLDLVLGDRHTEPATLLIHLRLDDTGTLPTPAAPAGSVGPVGPSDAAQPDLPAPAPAPTDTAARAATRPGAAAGAAAPADSAAPADTPTPAAPGPIAWLDTGHVLPLPVAEHLTCTATVQALLVDRRGNPLHLGRTHRTATRAQLRALRVRDGHRCAFPGCDATRYLEAHHVRWWRHDGPTDLDNLVLICGFHHRLIHEHGYLIHPASTGAFTFARPDGTPVPTAGPPTAGSADDLLAAHAARQIAIDGATITPRWGGERLDPNPILRWLVPELRAAAA